MLTNLRNTYRVCLSPNEWPTGEYPNQGPTQRLQFLLILHGFWKLLIRNKARGVLFIDVSLKIAR